MSDLGQDPQVVADAEGLELVMPGPDEIFVDLDSPEDVTRYEQLRVIAFHNGLELVERKRTRSRGGGTHVYVQFPRTLKPLERVAWQAALGSDRVRELLSLLRLQDWTARKFASVFFEVPGSDNELPVQPLPTRAVRVRDERGSEL